MICDRCYGTGEIKSFDIWGKTEYVKCLKCNGKGEIQKGRCVECDGTGEIETYGAFGERESFTCPTCNGKGYIE